MSSIVDARIELMKETLQEYASILTNEVETTVDVERVPVISEKLKQVEKCYQYCQDLLVGESGVQVQPTTALELDTGSESSSEIKFKSKQVYRDKANTETVRNAIADELELMDGIFSRSMPLDEEALTLADRAGANEKGAGVTSNKRISDWLYYKYDLAVDPKGVACFMRKALNEVGIPAIRSFEPKCAHGSLRYQVWTPRDRSLVAAHIRENGEKVLKGSEKRKREKELNAVKHCKFCNAHKVCTVCNIMNNCEYFPTNSEV